MPPLMIGPFTLFDLAAAVSVGFAFGFAACFVACRSRLPVEILALNIGAPTEPPVAS